RAPRVLRDGDERHGQAAGIERGALAGRKRHGPGGVPIGCRRSDRGRGRRGRRAGGSGEKREGREERGRPPAHGLREPTNRARPGSTPPPPGSEDAVATASATFSASSARDFSTPHTTGNVAFPAAASLCAALPSVAASASTSSRSSLIWNASPILR